LGGVKECPGEKKSRGGKRKVFLPKKKIHVTGLSDKGQGKKERRQRTLQQGHEANQRGRRLLHAWGAKKARSFRWEGEGRRRGERLGGCLAER